MIFADANIVLETALPDRPNRLAVDTWLGAEQDRVCMSMLSVHLLYHFGRRVGADDVLLHAITELFLVVGLTRTDYEWAVRHEKGRDFEDALQVAAAIRAGADTFVTLDTDLINAYSGHTMMRFYDPRDGL